MKNRYAVQFVSIHHQLKHGNDLYVVEYLPIDKILNYKPAHKVTIWKNGVKLTSWNSTAVASKATSKHFVKSAIKNK